MSLAVLALLTAGCGDPNTSNYDPMGNAADAAGMPLTDVPADQVASCVAATVYGAFVGDADALELWHSVGESDVALAEACLHIGRNDPKQLATMHWNWTASLTTTP